MKKETRNSKMLKSFTKYCESHPSERFFQALRNWIGCNFIYISDDYDGKKRPVLHDTFYIESIRRK